MIVLLKLRRNTRIIRNGEIMEISIFVFLGRRFSLCLCLLSTYKEQNGCNLNELTEGLQCEY